jgi:hypothetical protein
LAKIAVLTSQDIKPELAQRRSHISRIVDLIGQRSFGISAIADYQHDARRGVDFSGGLPAILRSARASENTRGSWSPQTEEQIGGELSYGEPQSTSPAFHGGTRSKYKRVK